MSGINSLIWSEENEELKSVIYSDKYKIIISAKAMLYLNYIDLLLLSYSLL